MRLQNKIEKVYIYMKIENSGWPIMLLEDAVEICDNQRKPVNSKERAKRLVGKKQEELYPYYGATGEVGYIDEYIVDGEYVLLGEDGVPFLDAFASKAYLISGKGWVNNHVHILRSKTNNRFLCYYLNAFSYKGFVSGTTRLKLTQASMKKIPIPCPLPEEQKRIVNRIEELFSELDKAVEALQTIKAQLTIYRQAVLKEAFERKSDWRECCLGDVLCVLTDYHANGSYKVLKDNVTLLEESGYAIMIRATNFEKNDFKNDLKYIDKHAYDFLKKSQLFGGEVLMGKIGNAGRVYYMKDLGRPMSLAMNMFAMRFIDEIDSKFVYYFLNSLEAVNDIKKYIKGVGTPTIDKKSVRSIKFRYPSYAAQKQILAEIESRLSVCDNIEQIVDITLQQTEAMRQSILKHAFEERLL